MSNEAAERLRKELLLSGWSSKTADRLLNNALGEERHATVERIRARYNALPSGQYRLMGIYDVLRDEASA